MKGDAINRIWLAFGRQLLQLFPKNTTAEPVWHCTRRDPTLTPRVPEEFHSGLFAAAGARTKLLRDYCLVKLERYQRKRSSRYSTLRRT
jgi:hypothetical protein